MMLTTLEDTNNNLYGDTGLSSYAHHMDVVSRKRPRDEDNHRNFNHSLPFNCNVNNNRNEVTFLGDDFSSHMQLEKLQLDRFITHHMEKARLELEHRRKRHSRTVIAAIEANMMHKLQAKEEEIQKIKIMNWTLEDRIKSLCIENQMWRELAQTNQATVNALQNNLQQVLVQEDQSCCGSNNDETEEEVERRTLVRSAVEVSRFNGKVDGSCDSRVCRSCGEEEACVLLLPCRHLCLCTVCGGSVHICPVCNWARNFTIHVNMSS